MKYTNIVVESLGKRIRLRFPQKYRRRVVDNSFWEMFIPRVSIVNSERQTLLTVSVFTSRQFSFSLKGRVCIIRHNFSPAGIKDIIVVVGYLLERERQKEGYYSFHGSLISSKEKAVALIGGLSGMGKTSLALYMASKKWEFNSDEKFIIDAHDLSVAGCIRKISPDEKLKIGMRKYRVAYANTKSPVKKTRLKIVVFPILTQSKKEYRILRYNKRKLYWHLYEEATRDIRLLNGLINRFSFPLPSLDEPKIASLRIRNIRKIASRIPGFFVVGTKEQIYKFLTSLIKSST